MRIYRIDHIAQVVPDLGPQVELLRRLFGFWPTHRWDNPDAGTKGVRMAVPGSWGHTWMVLAPSGQGSALGSWLDERGGRPGLHHVGVEVPDLDAAVTALEERGLKPTDGVAGRWAEASLTPPEHGPGVLFRIRGPGTLAMCGDDDAVTAESPEPDAGSLGVVALDHVSQAFEDRDKLARWYAELAGFAQVWRTPIDEHPDMADLVLNIPGSSICWEVIAPRGENSFIERFLARNGAAAHHVAFEVADWERAMEACRKNGVESFDDEEGVTDGARWRHTFLHPKQTGGILVQLFWEERPGVWVRSDKIPPER